MTAGRHNFRCEYAHRQEGHYLDRCAEGNYALVLPSNGRYVVRAEFAAFAPVTKEVMINAATPTGQADLEMILLSRVPKEQNQQQNAGIGQFGSVTASGRGSQRLSVTGDQLSLSLAANGGGDTPLQGMSALASTADATNDSVSVNGAMGQTAGFGRGAETCRIASTKCAPAANCRVARAAKETASKGDRADLLVRAAVPS